MVGAFVVRGWVRVVLACLLGLVTSLSCAQIVHLRMICWDGEDNIKPVRLAVEQFELAHPNIKVDLQSVVQNYQDKLLAEVAAGTAPDVVHMDPSNFRKFSDRGALLPLNQFFKLSPGFDLSKYYKILVDASSAHGQLYILPRDIAPMMVVYYNKKIFDEEGLPYPDGKWTWDFHERPELKEHDFLWMLHRLTKFGPDGKPTRWGFAMGKGTLAKMFWEELGAKEANDFENPTKILYDDPRIAEGYQLAADLSLKYHYMPTDSEINSEMQTNEPKLFTEGKVAMIQDGIWNSPLFRKELVPGQPGYFDWDIALAPGYKDGTRIYPTGGSGYSIMSQTKHPYESWLLTAWMSGEPGMLTSAQAGMAQPALRWMCLTEPWIPGPDTPPALVAPRNRIIMDYGANHIRYGPTSIFWPEVKDFVDQQEESIFDGSSTAQAALARGNRIAQARLDTLLRDENLPLFDWRVGWAIATAIVALALWWIYGPEYKKKRSRREKQESRTAYLFILPCLLGILCFTLGPMLLSMLMSTAEWDIIRPAHWRGFGNFAEALTSDPVFWVSLRVTAVYTAVSVPLGLVISLALALLLNTNVRGMALWRTCYYIPAVASGVAASLVWKAVFRADGGVLNTIIYGPDGHRNFLGLASLLRPLASSSGQVDWLGSSHTALASLILMSVWGVGGGMIIMLAGLQGVPQFYYEAAFLDGAGAWQRFKSVTLPLISPTLFFTMVTSFIGSFQVFTQAFVMTHGGPNNATQFYMLHLYNQAFLSLRMGYASSMAWMLFFIVLVFTGIQLKGSKWVYYEGVNP
jgi:multiple sugar transport system permease protein